MARNPDPQSRPGPILQMLPIDTLIANPRNPNKHPEEQINRLMAALRKDGQTKPVLVRKANNMLIAGHGVTMAMRRLGLPEIRAVLWDVDQATADRYMLADNRLGHLSSHDDDMVADLLREIDRGDWLAAGYSDAEAEKLLASFERRELAVHEIDTADIRDDFWIGIRGPLPRQAEVLQRIKQLLGEYPDVAVELGTIEEAPV